MHLKWKDPKNVLSLPILYFIQEYEENSVDGG